MKLNKKIGHRNGWQQLKAAVMALLSFFSFCHYANAQVATTPEAPSPSRQLAALLNLPAPYAAGTIDSIETADRVLKDTAQGRARIEVRFSKEQRECSEKFYVTSCVGKAKERRRHDLAQLRPAEIEAGLFKRRTRVIEREKILADKRAQDEQESLKRSQEHQHGQIKEEKKPVRAQNDGTVEAKPATDVARRTAQHQAKMKRLAAEDAAHAQKRAQNVSAYQKKVMESEARQREIAARKAEKK